MSRQSATAGPDDELLVTWQDPETRRYHGAGLLSHADDGLYRFRYLDTADSLSSFRAFLGFSDMQRDYASPHLFPGRLRWHSRLTGRANYR